MIFRPFDGGKLSERRVGKPILRKREDSTLGPVSR